MKKILLLTAAMLLMHTAMAQMITETGISGPVDDSFTLTPDTLWFLTGTDFMEGKPFQIINNHDYPIDVINIDQFGIPCPTCVPWYTDPHYSVYPVTIPAKSSITTLVKFFAIDSPVGPMVYDTLNVNTIGFYSHVILALDSITVQIGMAEPGDVRITASPNPFSEAVRITLSGLRDGKIKLMVYDALMRPIKELDAAGMGNPSPGFTWDGTGRNGQIIGNGVYFLMLRTNSGQKTLKVVKI